VTAKIDTIDNAPRPIQQAVSTKSFILFTKHEKFWKKSEFLEKMTKRF